jgi:hypothetical protein
MPQVDLLLYQVFPRRLILGCATSDQVLMIEFLTAHPHVSLDLPSISSLSLDSILFTQVPALDTVHDKLESFVDGMPSLADSGKIKDDLAHEIFLWVKQRYVEKSKAPTSPAVVVAFRRTIATLAADLPTASMFPLGVWPTSNHRLPKPH